MMYKYIYILCDVFLTHEPDPFELSNLFLVKDLMKNMKSLRPLPIRSLDAM